MTLPSIESIIIVSFFVGALVFLEAFEPGPYKWIKLIYQRHKDFFDVLAVAVFIGLLMLAFVTSAINLGRFMEREKLACDNLKRLACACCETALDCSTGHVYAKVLPL